MKTIILLLSLITCQCFATSTMRLDYYHTGGLGQELFAVDEIVIEPLPWPGNPNQPIDTTLRGKYVFEVVDISTKKIIYSRSFSNIYQEWITTEEASKQHKTFSESLRFPEPKHPVEITLKVRKDDQQLEFKELWRTQVNPSSMFIKRAKKAEQYGIIPLMDNGDPSKKVDLLLLGDGYTEAEKGKFIADAQRMLKVMFATSPYKERKNDFNVWGLMPPAQESGVNRPSTGKYRNNPVGSSYDTFGSERYALIFDNKTFRKIAAEAPYEFVEVLMNNDTYGGGGIYGLHATTSVDSGSAEYIFIHEFGHHFAGLADAYYSSPVAYNTSSSVRPEPFEPNVTANTDRNTLKWKHLIKESTPVPTAWQQDKYDAYVRVHEKERSDIRAKKSAEMVMDALFQERLDWEAILFDKNKYENDVGLFEGANYQAKGFYRSQQNCLMFTRTMEFCDVCNHAVQDVIDQYSK